MSHPTFRKLAKAGTLSGFMAVAFCVPAAGAADNQGQASAGMSATPSSGHIVGQSVGPGVPVSGTVRPLQLSDAQRARISGVLASKDTEIDLNLEKYKSAKSFEPRVGETVPKALKGQGFPLPLHTEMPTIREYEYLKLKGQILIVNPLSRKIVDMFPAQSA